MASFEQKIAAEVVLERGRKLQEKQEEKHPKKLEAERLYFWILSRIAYEIEEAYTPQKSYKLTIEEKNAVNEKFATVLCHENMTEYHLRYVQLKDLNDVLVRVKCILNSMNGYNAYILQMHSEKKKAIMIVSIEL